MQHVIITENQKQLIERMGVFHEKRGIQPAPARVLALLFISDKTELTFEEIKDALNISKSATSGAINYLLSLGRIEYITRPGDRKRYFRMKIYSWKDEMVANLENLTAISSFMKEVLKQRPAETRDFNNALAEIIEFLDFFKNEIALILEKWSKRKGN